jgi:hypothetical protein
MRITLLHDLDKAAKFLQENFSSPTHWPDWNVIISRYHNTKFYYFAAYQNDELTGLCPVHEIKKRFTSQLSSGRVFYNPYGGWIFKRKTGFDILKTPVGLNQTLSGFTLPLLEEFNVTYEKNIPPDFLTILIDLDKPYERIFEEEFESRVRGTIRKAVKNEVTVKIDKDIDLFYHYFTESCDKRGQRKQARSFFTDLFERSGNIRFEISWTLFNEKPIGLDVICYDKNFSIGYWNYVFPDAPKLGQGTLIIADSIRRSQLYGCRYFDFCFAEKERLSAIYQFKKGFSKTEVPIIHFGKRPFTYRIINRAERFMK